VDRSPLRIPGLTGAPAGPRPTSLQRLGGVAAISGAFLWPLGLVYAATGAFVACGGTPDCAPGREMMAPLALAGALLTAGLAAMELRAPDPAGILDLVGALSLATATALLVISTILGSFALVWPGFLLFMVGSMVIGASGWTGTRRSRMGSLCVGVGAATIVVFLVAGALAVGSGSTAGSLAESTMLGFLLFSLGWIWLGAQLALCRPLGTRTTSRP